MRAAGRKAFEARDAAKTDAISRVRDARVSRSRMRGAVQGERAPPGSSFSAQPPGYRRMATWWVLSAKREETQREATRQLIALSAVGARLVPIPSAVRRA